MIVAINYADWKYKKAQRFNSRTAIRKGKADQVIEYSPKDLDRLFVQKNKDILSQKRGNGYWLWKPYIILDALTKISEGDYLVYLDSGAYYINHIGILTEQMEKDKQIVMSFELPLEERRYTKRDIFVGLQCDGEDYADTNQRMATMVLFKKSREAVDFVKEWLLYGQKDGIITDAPNCYGCRNYKGFVENRHDQSIFSLLCKKYGIKPYRDPSQMGRFPDIFLASELNQRDDFSNYPQIIAEHRNWKVSSKIYWEQILYTYAPKRIVKLYYEHFGSLVQHIDMEKIALLTDNTPIQDERYGYGMYKVVNRLAEALDQNIATIICTDRNYQKKNVSSTIQYKLKVANQFHNIQSGLAGKSMFLSEMFPIARNLKKKGIRWIFIPLGADYRELERAYLISIIFHFKVAIYIVDDFAEYYIRILKRSCGRKRIEKKVSKYIGRADTIFVISDGMKKRIRKVYGRNSHVLPVPYQYTSIKIGDGRKLQIMFIGGINELYSVGLRDIAGIIDELNAENGWEIVLRFTYESISEVIHMIGNFACIQAARLKTEHELRQEMRSSLFCFMPYSDEDRMRVMQETSFPSKLVEYLGAARSIVVYGSRHNSAASYFDKYGLSTVIHGRDKERLKECILFHIQQEMDYSSMYQGVLKKVHSYERVRKILLGNL